MKDPSRVAWSSTYDSSLLAERGRVRNFDRDRDCVDRGRPTDRTSTRRDPERSVRSGLADGCDCGLLLLLVKTLLAAGLLTLILIQDRRIVLQHWYLDNRAGASEETSYHDQFSKKKRKNTGNTQAKHTALNETLLPAALTRTG